MHVLGLRQDGEELVVREEVQSREYRPLGLEVVAQALLDLVEELGALPAGTKEKDENYFGFLFFFFLRINTRNIYRCARTRTRASLEAAYLIVLGVGEESERGERRREET